jgi:nucleoid-associated protein EbfC
MDFAKLIQQAQRAQTDMQQALTDLVVEGSAGGGLVMVQLNGLKDVKTVRIDSQALTGEDPTLVNDLVLAAWEDAARLIGQRSTEILRKLGLPAGFPGLS